MLLIPIVNICIDEPEPQIIMYHVSGFVENWLHKFKRCKTERKAKLYIESWTKERYRASMHGGRENPACILKTCCTSLSLDQNWWVRQSISTVKGVTAEYKHAQSQKDWSVPGLKISSRKEFEAVIIHTSDRYLNACVVSPIKHIQFTCKSSKYMRLHEPTRVENCIKTKQIQK